jgi:asperthecin polyketide synthase
MQSTWADLTLTVGEYLYKRMAPDDEKMCMDVRDMEVLEAQVLPETVSPESQPAQFILIEGVLDMSQRRTRIHLYTAGAEGTRKTDRAFATATVYYEDAQAWQAEWQLTSHLVTTRADLLWKAATSGDASDTGRVSRLSRGAAYQLFANVVDYGTRYRGMQRVALDEDAQEATADIMLDRDRHGTWHTPPHWMDSAFQLAGFVMNAFGVQGDGEAAGSSRDFFYITPGWRHLKLTERLQPGPDATYRNYVRMFPIKGDTGAFAGDIYLLRGHNIVGVCAGIKFKRVPRVLMPIMFPRGQKAKSRNHGATPAKVSANGHVHFQAQLSTTVGESKDSKSPTAKTASPRQQDLLVAVPATEITGEGQDETAGNPRVAACLRLIADETGLDIEDLAGDAAFAELGVDSLMSLTLAGKIRAELGMDVQASIFIECTTVQDLVNWLSK